MQVEEKITSGIYAIARFPCVLCGSEDHEVLSEKERYGLGIPVVICRVCGLVQLNPRPTGDAYREFYLHEYRRLYRGEEIPTESFFREQYTTGSDIYRFLSRHLVHNIENIRVLEIGSGAGGILQYFRDQGNEVSGCDLDREYLEYGVNQHGLDLKYGDLAQMASMEPPDMILYSQVLEHVNNPVDELRQLRKICHEGTVIYIGVPGIRYLPWSYGGDFLQFVHIAHTHHFTKTTIEDVLGLAGFQSTYCDEHINCICRLAEPREEKHDSSDEYPRTVRFLKFMEWYRRFPVLYLAKTHLESRLKHFVIRLI
jgi:2-polyprenyl-3-methyl-5-hydroxy-6-metoxy-1,4-benzoquinol methylase